MNSVLFCSYSFLRVCTCLAVPVSHSKPASVTWQLILLCRFSFHSFYFYYLYHFIISVFKKSPKHFKSKYSLSQEEDSTKPVGIDRPGINLATKIMRCDHKSNKDMAAHSTVTSERAPVEAEVIQTPPQSTYTKYKCREAAVCSTVSQQEGRDRIKI